MYQLFSVKQQTIAVQESSERGSEAFHWKVEKGLANKSKNALLYPFSKAH